MHPNASKEDIEKVAARIEEGGCEVDLGKGINLKVLSIIGSEEKVDFELLGNMSGVDYAQPIQRDIKYSLVSRRIGGNNVLPDRIIGIGNESIGKSLIGGNRPFYFVGPCAVENEDQMRQVAEMACRLRADDNYGQYGIRGGCFKPRTAPHGWSGMGEKGLKILDDIRGEFELPIITEVRRERHVDLVSKVADVLQIGARNCQNQDLLWKAGGSGMPVLYKRGKGMSIEEWFRGAQHIIKGGNGGIDRSNRNIILCERGEMGMSGDGEFLRYPSQMQAGQVAKYETYLPVVFDPSHSAGDSRLVTGSSLGAIAMGYDALLVEVHPNPKEARTDAKQQLNIEEAESLIESCNENHRLNHGPLKERREQWFRDKGYRFVR